jgi:hypothetical protein
MSMDMDEALPEHGPRDGANEPRLARADIERVAELVYGLLRAELIRMRERGGRIVQRWR